MKALSNIAVSNKKDKKNKKDIWYLDIAVAIYMTHNLRFYITPHLDHQTANIEIADSTILKMEGAKTIDLYVFIENEYKYIELRNVYYLLELDQNLISFRVFEEKKCKFYIVDNLL